MGDDSLTAITDTVVLPSVLPSPATVKSWENWSNVPRLEESGGGAELKWTHRVPNPHLAHKP